ncbi:MAG: hypothetical protein ABJB76_01440 [Candidatus Nitrosocosmicus sp.]
MTSRERKRDERKDYTQPAVNKPAQHFIEINFFDSIKIKFLFIGKIKDV